MDRATYEDLKRLADETLRRAEEAHKQDLATIERLWATAQTNGALPVPNSTQAMSRRPREPGRKGKFLKDVRSVVATITGTFDFAEVYAALEEKNPGLIVKSGTMKAILKKLSEQGEIEVVSQGVGRRATQYRRK